MNIFHCHLMNVHNRVTAQRTSGRKVIGPQKGRDDAVLVHLPDHSAVHEVD